MASDAVGGNMHMDTGQSRLLMSILSSYDLRGYLEAAMASEAVMALEAIGGNMHMDTRVIKVADVNSEVI